MQEKENKIPAGSEKDHKQKEPLSETITDAHAAGDGALERGKDSLIASDDDTTTGAETKSKEEAY